MTSIDLNSNYDLRSKIIENIMEQVDYDDVDINLDDFELNIEYEVSINVSNVELIKKDTERPPN